MSITGFSIFFLVITLVISFCRNSETYNIVYYHSVYPVRAGDVLLGANGNSRNVIKKKRMDKPVFTRNPGNSSPVSKPETWHFFTRFDYLFRTCNSSTNESKWFGQITFSSRRRTILCVVLLLCFPSAPQWIFVIYSVRKLIYKDSVNVGLRIMWLKVFGVLRRRCPWSESKNEIKRHNGRNAWCCAIADVCSSSGACEVCVCTDHGVSRPQREGGGGRVLYDGRAAARRSAVCSRTSGRHK